MESFEAASTPGQHRVIKGSRVHGLEKVLEAIADGDINATQLVRIVTALADRVSGLQRLPELGETESIRMAAAALRVAHRHQALMRLRRLIENDAIELEFQNLLQQNWWMLGGQYISMIPQREWTVEDSVDILLESADRYFDIVEQ